MQSSACDLILGSGLNHLGDVPRSGTADRGMALRSVTKMKIACDMNIGNRGQHLRIPRCNKVAFSGGVSCGDCFFQLHDARAC